MLPDREQCHAWCSCAGPHWRTGGGEHRWRPGLDGCSHPGHDEGGLTVWGISAYLPESPSSARSWFWCAMRAGEMVEHGWRSSARAALDAGRRATRRVPARRCDLVAAEGWRHLAELVAGESDAAA